MLHAKTLIKRYIKKIIANIKGLRTMPLLVFSKVELNYPSRRKNLKKIFFHSLCVPKESKSSSSVSEMGIQSRRSCDQLYEYLRTVPTIVIAHTFCASPDTRISYRQCLLMPGYFCAV